MSDYTTDIDRRKALEISGSASALFLAGCADSGSSGQGSNSNGTGQDAAGNDTGSSGGDSGQQKVRLLTHYGSETEVFNGIIDRFEEENGATVELTQIPPANYWQQFSTALGTSNAPDMWGKGPGPGELGKYVARGVPVDLSEHLEQSFVDEFAGTRTCRYEGEDILSWQSQDGALYGLPIDVFGWCYWYNRDVLADIGIDESKVKRRSDMTWQEFRDVLQQAKDAGYTPIVMGGNKNMDLIGIWVADSLFKQVGAQTMTQTLLGRNDRKLNEEPFVEAMRKYQRLYDDGLINESVTAITRPQSVNLFYNGDAAFYSQGSWMPSQIDRMIGEDAPEIHEKMGYFWHPYYPDAYQDGKDERYGATGNVMALNKQSIEERGNMDESIAFLKHFFNQNNQHAFFSEGGVPVARVDAWSDLNEEQKVQQTVIDQLNEASTTYPIASGAFLPRSWEAFVAGVGDLFSGTDPQKIMDTVESARQDDLEEYS
ncbi:ABC transporter substrate-binding protein [Halococcus agarilyticus]|uniref:ABC transporter substrate-binding protein n=1 Tax=Halococcus agarilyticus TaxID=1232219 RepID=UPI0006776563|nr:extracellular solute-binding protein [Halococcus agarilyticus]